MFSDSGSRVYRIPVDASWAGDPDRAELLNDAAVAMPVMHRKGVRPLVANLYASAYAFDFGDVETGQTLTKDLSLTNHGNRDVKIDSITISNDTSFTHHEKGSLLPRERSMTIQLSFSPEKSVGTESATLSIISDADLPSMNISLTGTSVPCDRSSCFINTLI